MAGINILPSDRTTSEAVSQEPSAWETLDAEVIARATGALVAAHEAGDSTGIKTAVYDLVNLRLMREIQVK